MQETPPKDQWNKNERVQSPGMSLHKGQLATHFRKI